MNLFCYVVADWCFIVIGGVLAGHLWGHLEGWALLTVIPLSLLAGFARGVRAAHTRATHDQEVS